MFGLTVQRLGRRIKIELLVTLQASAMTDYRGPSNSNSIYTAVAGRAFFDRGGSVALLIAILYIYIYIYIYTAVAVPTIFDRRRAGRITFRPRRARTGNLFRPRAARALNVSTIAGL